MLESKSRCWAEINVTKIKHNVDEIHKMIPKTTKIMGIVKANGYGHGDIRIAQELCACGVDFFGVSSMDEAVQLRNHGINANILILGYTPKEHWHYLQELDLIQTLISLEFAQKLNAYAKDASVTLRAHVKVDTGMSRLGVQCKRERWDSAEVKAMYQFSNLKVEGIFSHFSVSDSLDKEEGLNFTANQIACYDQILAELKADGINPGITHLQNSYGIMNYPNLQYDYVRPGLLYLGVTSDDAISTNQQPDFQPIMTWKANVTYVKTIEKGCCVSYGCHFKAPQQMRIATVSCGYADGYPRALSNQGKEVLLHGMRALIIGNICMDQMMIDVSHIENVQEGDEVILFGYEGEILLSVDELSRKCHTINNETLCWISARVPRLYIK